MKRTILIFTMLFGCAVDTGEVRQGTRCETCEDDDLDPTGGGTAISPTSPEAAGAVAATVSAYGMSVGGLQISAYSNGGGTGPLAGPRGVTGCVHTADWSTGLCCTLWEDGLLTCIAF